jgi:hypothetical protein
MQVFNVVWGHGIYTDEGTLSTYAGVHGTYLTEVDAKKGLGECKQEFLDEVMNNPDLSEEDKESFRCNVQVYGSVNDDYFEIDYTNGDCPVEIYIQITHTHVQD